MLEEFEATIRNGDRGQHKPHGEPSIVPAETVAVACDGESVRISQGDATVSIIGRKSAVAFVRAAARVLGEHVERAVAREAQYLS